MGENTEIGNKVLLFDGVCNLCNSTVNFIIDRDHKQAFSFAPLQSSIAQELLRNTPVRPEELQSIVLVDNEKIFVKSDAALRVTKYLSGAWSVLYLFRIFPRSLRDLVYDFIARHRYRWFGRQDECRIPTPELKARFLA
ncbi:MAG: thiol-disulfide oxidoreductase DCC family protein [Cyclobacteriaceae bacterium]|nr:thiol-disulfide oxidoreductase DCC family protein [Cyclobacteriaceae bacterium HetDA_MAG_MS6]